MKKPVFLILEPNSDPVFGPLATRLDGESGILLSILEIDGETFVNGQFPKAGIALTQIPISLVSTSGS